MFKVKVKKDELAKAVSQCSSVVARRSTMDIFLRVLLTVEDYYLSLAATDLEVTLVTRIPADVSGQGQVAIKPKAFADFLRVGTANEVVLDLGDNFTLNGVCGGFSASHFGVSAETFPKMTQPEDSDFVRIDAQALVDAIDKTIYSVTGGDSTYNLKGIYWAREQEEGQNPCLRLVSTDAQRLNVATIEAENLDVFQEEGGILVPKKGLQELKTMCEPLADIYLGVYDNSLVAKSDNSLIKIRLLSGNYPQYQAIIPTELEHSLWANRRELLDTLKRISIVSDENYHFAEFNLRKELLTVTSSNPELGKVKDSVGIDYDGPELMPRFNPNFIVDLLNSLKSERVRFQFSESHPSYLVTAPEDPGYCGVLVSVGYDL
ncbi:MAG: DNA polymerase III subunit beta [Deltaproteobacteria bacterium]|jgi:DNA polymerase-3 subunit beta|nr:DNA polymerase III subunit beta [Deltaproteobacteria bacterium]